MTTFAIYDDGAFVAERDFDEKPSLAGKPYRKFYSVETVKPSFNSATQVRTGPVVEEDHDKEIRRHVWTVRDKTAEELDADKAEQVSAVNVLTFKVGLDHENRLRKLEGRAEITADQFRAALKARL